MGVAWRGRQASEGGGSDRGREGETRSGENFIVDVAVSPSITAGIWVDGASVASSWVSVIASARR